MKFIPILLSSIAVLLIVFGLWNILVAHPRDLLTLPGGYYLQKRFNGKILLHNPSKDPVIQDQISEFKVAGTYIYGWVDNSSEQFFFLDTYFKDFRLLKTWSDLDYFTDTKSLPRLTINNSFTFWDVTGHHKQVTWKQAEQGAAANP